MAVVHSFHDAGVPSGEDEVVKAEMSALRSAGADVWEATTRVSSGERRSETLRAGVRVGTGFGRSPLGQLIRWKPDVVHVHNLFPGYGTRWLQWLSGPTVVTLHNYRLLCGNGYLFRDGHQCADCVTHDRWAGVRHRCYRSAPASATVAIGNIGGPARSPLTRAADVILVPSRRALATFNRLGWASEKLRVAPHFLPAAIDPGGAAEHHPEPHHGWVFVGRLSPEKGVDRLLQHWPPAERLDVIGAGPLDALVQSCEEATRGAVRHRGPLPREALLRLLPRYCGLVFASPWPETFGLVAMEALAAGLPVLSFGDNAVSDLVREHDVGIVGNDLEELAELLTVAHGRFPTMRERCRATFVEHFSQAAFARDRTLLYRSLL